MNTALTFLTCYTTWTKRMRISELVLLILNLSMLMWPQTEAQALTIESILKNKLENYQKSKLPDLQIPTKVEVAMSVLSFSSISVIDMDYTLNVVMKMRWKDDRLKNTFFSGRYDMLHFKEKIWIPDIYFRNLKEARFHNIPVPNIVLDLYPSNAILLLTQTFSLKLSCDMNLWNFPFDIQMCYIDMASYYYSDKEIALNWLNPDQEYDDDRVLITNQTNKAVHLHNKLIINEFEIPSTLCCKEQITKQKSNYTSLKAVFRLERKFGFYITYVYLPCLMILFVCWLSFFVDYKSAPARVSICVFCILSIISQGNSVINTLPKVSYSKAIDWWILSCFTLVIMSFLEYVLVNISYRTDKLLWLRFKFNAYKIDHLAIIVFPIIVAIFNVCYWGYYLSTRYLESIDTCPQR